MGHLIRKEQEERGLFIQSFKYIADAISKCGKSEEFEANVKKFVEFVKRNIGMYEKYEGQGGFEFDGKFDIDGSEFKAKIAEL
jgi:hypothetical protein